MDELEKIYMADDAISGADVYKPITDWAMDKINQPFEPFFNVKPVGISLETENGPGVKAWHDAFPDNPPPSVREMEVRNLAPRIKERDGMGGLALNQRQYSNKQGLFGTTNEPAFKEYGQEQFNQEFASAINQGADWFNQSGAVMESSLNPAEDRNWQHMPSIQPQGRQQRDYGVPRNQEFSIEKHYKPGLARDISEHLLNAAYGPAGQAASADLHNRYVSTHQAVNGKDLWDRLKNDFGVNQAAQIISKLDYFSGVRGNPTFSGNENIRFTLNEAERAMQKLENENSHLPSPENPAYSAHGFDFGNPPPEPKEQPFSLRPTYEKYGYDYEAGPDPRQYGVPKNTRFSTNGTYTPEFVEDLARVVADPAYGSNGAKLAQDWRNAYVDNNHPVGGYGLYNRLVRDVGQQRAHEILRKLDYFSGIDAFDAPGLGQFDGEDFLARSDEGYPTLFR